jgi:hypothetical protein
VDPVLRQRYMSCETPFLCTCNECQFISLMIRMSLLGLLLHLATRIIDPLSTV